LNMSADKDLSPLKYLFVSLVCLLSLASCAPKLVAPPVISYENIPLDRALSELGAVRSVEAVMAIEYQKKDSTMSGDAFVNLSDDKLTLRLYYMGFLYGEVSEENGIVKSKPKLDKNKSAILVDGLKNSFLWWTLKDYTLTEKEDTYVLTNSYREVVVDRKTLLPLRQTLNLDSGDVLTILYDEPAITEEAAKVGQSSLLQRYQSKLTITLKNYTVRIKIKSYSASQQTAS